MKRLFVDSFFYIALLNPKDQHHECAKALAQTIGGSEFWTTDLVFVETAGSCRYPDIRVAAAKLIRYLATEASTNVVHLNAELFEKALRRYEGREDKSWSFTDCLSFVVMEENGITDALTGDAHFSQAGFRALSLADPDDTLSETIVILDMVKSTSEAVRRGWKEAGGPIQKALDGSIEAIPEDEFGLACRKFTGDGYMLTFNRGGPGGTVASLPLALGAMGVLSRHIQKWNEQNDALTIKLRFAVHFGAVEKHSENDRTGLDVIYAFRLEGVDSIESAWGCEVTALPEYDYAILSDHVVHILQQQSIVLPWHRLGSLPVGEFGRREVFLLENISKLDGNTLIQNPGPVSK